MGFLTEAGDGREHGNERWVKNINGTGTGHKAGAENEKKVPIR